ncbi:MAG: flagellar biosynthetic protein FliO, partial [Terracidiphilus sp.]
GGGAGWLLGRVRGTGAQPRLELLERIALAPRQSLALVEAEGRRFLVATSSEGAPAFYPLDERPGREGDRRSPGGRTANGRSLPPARSLARLSW